MSVNNCRITGEANVGILAIALGAGYELVWDRADPEIHASVRFLGILGNDGRTFFKAKYELGAVCPHDSRLFHARLWGHEASVDDPPALPPTDPTERAIRIVARRVLVNAVDGGGPGAPEWEDYPEIGEHDWQAVLAQVRYLAECTDVQTEHYESAYRHLAGRATTPSETEAP